MNRRKETRKQEPYDETIRYGRRSPRKDLSNRRPKMSSVNGNTRSLEATISLSNIKDQISALLYAVGLVKDSEDIVELEFKRNDLYKELVPISFKIKKRTMEGVITHNG
jgi:hypothetical protein